MMDYACQGSSMSASCFSWIFDKKWGPMTSEGQGKPAVKQTAEASDCGKCIGGFRLFTGINGNRNKNKMIMWYYIDRIYWSSQWNYLLTFALHRILNQGPVAVGHSLCHPVMSNIPRNPTWTAKLAFRLEIRIVRYGKSILSASLSVIHAGQKPTPRFTVRAPLFASDSFQVAPVKQNYLMTGQSLCKSCH